MAPIHLHYLALSHFFVNAPKVDGSLAGVVAVKARAENTERSLAVVRCEAWQRRSIALPLQMSAGLHSAASNIQTVECVL